MTSRRISLAAVCMLALATQGCMSIGNVQSADTLGKGNFQFGVEPGVQGVAVVAPGVTTGPLVYPHVDFSLRYGLADRFDLGIRAGQSFVELMGKFLITEPGSMFKLSVAPQLGGVFFSVGGAGISFISIALPVLMGIAVSDNVEIILGPRLQNYLLLGAVSGSGSASAYTMGVGGSLGVAFGIGDSLKILPEAAVSVPVVGAASSSSGGSGAGAGFAGLQFQFKLGFLIGRTRPLLTHPELEAPPMTPPPAPPGDAPPPPPPADGPGAGAPPPPPPPPQ